MKKARIDYSEDMEFVLKQLMECTGIDYKEELETIFKQLAVEPSNLVKQELGFVPPCFGKADIKLIIIGQDPTIQNVERRKNIKCTLNLDKAGSLTRYVEQICEGLGITIENVLATNIFKYFYTKPPAQTFNILTKHLSPNLDLLKRELSSFQSVPIITLGEPVLKLLTNDRAKVRYYWGYDSKTKASNGVFTSVKAAENKLGQIIYPFCHQPSLRKHFYKDTLDLYTHYVKDSSSNRVHSSH